MNNWSIQPYFNYTYADYRFEEFIDDQDYFSGNDLTGSAPHQVNTGLIFRQLSRGFMAIYIINILMQCLCAMTILLYSDAYHLMNLKLGYGFDFRKHWNLDFFAGINNLWNEKYASMILINASGFGSAAPRYYYPGLPRNYYAGVKISAEFRVSS